MKLIVGLGNPGEKYENTRHNVGYKVADSLRSTVDSDCEWEENRKYKAVVCRLKAVDILLAKPQTFMNSSGVAVRKLIDQYKIKLADIWVIHDDLDLRLGEYKIQLGVGPKLHYGIKSIEGKLGKKD
ncbi:MAG: Peptidyl-tRNA hydrolase, partial [Candidatus Woesebacteria bacterium GW2011_GWA1_39_21b]